LKTGNPLDDWDALPMKTQRAALTIPSLFCYDEILIFTFVTRRANAMKTNVVRRDFLRDSALGICLASQVAPAIGAVGANEKVNLGFIAVGGRNTYHLSSFLRLGGVNVLAVCDVDQNRLDKGAELAGGNVKKFKDFRNLLEMKEIDAVIIAPPDHWHCIPTILACEAGKDVYVEKPLGQNIKEGRAAVNAARKYDRIVQIGLQHRSGPHFIEVAEMIREGKLGEITQVQTFNQWDMYGMGHNGPQGLGAHPDSDPPEGVDYDLWLGPAPKRPFNPNRFHFTFYYNWDYSSGMMGAWGVHIFDTVQWIMGDQLDHVVASGGQYYYKHNIDTPDTAEAVFHYPNYIMNYTMRHTNGYPLHGEMDHGIFFFGTEGTIFINRNQYELYPEKDRKNPIIVKSRGMEDQHKQKFLDSVKTRKRTDSDIETGHVSSITAHLANIAYRTGRAIRWDRENETIIGDEEAAKLLTRVPREPWNRI
jgi:predicted dehydrogenase